MGLIGRLLGFFFNQTKPEKENPKPDTETQILKSLPNDNLSIPPETSNFSNEREIPDVYRCRTCGKTFSTEDELARHHSRSGIEDTNVNLFSSDALEKDTQMVSYYDQAVDNIDTLSPAEKIVIPDTNIWKIPEPTFTSYYEENSEVEPSFSPTSTEIFPEEVSTDLDLLNVEISEQKRIAGLWKDQWREYIKEEHEFRRKYNKSCKCDVCGNHDEELFLYNNQTYCEKHLPVERTRIKRTVTAHRHGSVKSYLKKVP